MASHLRCILLDFKTIRWLAKLPLAGDVRRVVAQAEDERDHASEIELQRILVNRERHRKPRQEEADAGDDEAAQVYLCVHAVGRLTDADPLAGKRCP